MLVQSKREQISIADVVAQSEKAIRMVSEIRASLLAPQSRKNPPSFNLTQVAALCGVDKGQMAYRLAKGDLPTGTLNASGSRREFFSL